jgi:hypothetical protein
MKNALNIESKQQKQLPSTLFFTNIRDLLIKLINKPILKDFSENSGNMFSIKDHLIT